MGFKSPDGSGMDHGLLNGLLDDDHPQYALLAGRAGGQHLYGGNAANDDLILEGTAHATKTTSYVLLQPNGGFVGIGLAAPGYQLHIKQPLADTFSIALQTPTNLAVTLGTYGAENGAIRLFLNGSEGLRLAAGSDSFFTGAVGIGTQTPGSPLHLKSTTTDVKIHLQTTAAGGFTYIEMERQNDTRGCLLQFSTDVADNWWVGLPYDGGNSNDDFVISSTLNKSDSKLIVRTSGVIAMPALPTSAAGLAAGDLWVDTTGGLNIVKRV